jgi:hypothetical protein
MTQRLIVCVQHQVGQSNPNTCRAYQLFRAGNQFMITFLTTHGDLPMMTITASGIDSITVEEHTKGAQEMNFSQVTD